MNEMRTLLFILCALGLACAGETGQVSGSLVTDSTPLDVESRESWEAAPAGCEGQDLSNADFAIADEAPELLVARVDGIAICVDTFSALETELGDAGDLEGVDALWLRYMASLQEAPELHVAEFSGSSNIVGVDPTPQTNRPDEGGLPGDDGSTGVDPTPQTNRPDEAEPVGVDPTPQTNRGDSTEDVDIVANPWEAVGGWER